MLVQRGLDHLAVAEFPDQCRIRNPFPLHATASALCADLMPHDDLAATPDYVLDWRKLESLERLRVGGRELDDLLVTPVDALIGADRAREVKDPVGVRELGQGVEVAVAEGGVSQPHDLHVLLRHRLPSIAPFAGGSHRSGGSLRSSSPLVGSAAAFNYFPVASMSSRASSRNFRVVGRASGVGSVNLSTTASAASLTAGSSVTRSTRAFAMKSLTPSAFIADCLSGTRGPLGAPGLPRGNPRTRLYASPASRPC